jgi:hypothetical protein
MKFSLGRKPLAGVATCIITGLAMINGAAANAATSATSSTHAIEVQLTVPSSGDLHPDASSGGQIYLCYISMDGGAVENNYVDVSFGATCQLPSFIVNGEVTFANNGHVYATSSTIGRSNSTGTWFSVKAQQGGTIGYRSALWCVDITLSNGAVGSGCLEITGM